MELKIHLKWAKNAKGDAKGRHKLQKGRKKGMPKTKTKKGAKMGSWPARHGLARRNPRGLSWANQPID